MAKYGRFNRFALIDGITKNDDGTIIVSGFASSTSEDSDKEIITADAMKGAIPGYMAFGAVREMHGKSAAGTALEIEVLDDGRTAFSALVVDPIAIKKVETGVYKGFSIGGKVMKRDDDNENIITELKLIEVSLVDRPANPEALITMFKAETDDTQTGTDAPEGDTETNKSETGNPVAETPTPAEPAKPDEIKKSIWAVKDFAGVLQTICYIVSDSAYEATYEGDSSPVPAKLRDWLAEGVVIFKAMAEEEMNEMLAGLTTAFPNAIALSEKAGDLAKGEGLGDLAKAGARYSKKSKQSLADIHKMASDICAKFDELGYKDAEEVDDDADDAGKSDKGDDLAKTEKIDTLEKSLLTVNEELAKAVALNAEKDTEITVAKARIVELEKEPEAPKGALFRLQKAITVEKGEDSEGVGGEVNPHKPGSQEAAEWAMKAVHSGKLIKV